MRELLQEEMDALVIAEHLVLIRKLALEALVSERDLDYQALGNIYGLATEVQFSAERVVKQYEDLDGSD